MIMCFVQEMPDAEGPVVEKIMALRLVKKEVSELACRACHLWVELGREISVCLGPGRECLFGPW